MAGFVGTIIFAGFWVQCSPHKWGQRNTCTGVTTVAYTAHTTNWGIPPYRPCRMERVRLSSMVVCKPILWNRSLCLAENGMPSLSYPKSCLSTNTDGEGQGSGNKPKKATRESRWQGHGGWYGKGSRSPYHADPTMWPTPHCQAQKATAAATFAVAKWSPKPTARCVVPSIWPRWTTTRTRQANTGASPRWRGSRLGWKQGLLTRSLHERTTV